MSMSQDQLFETALSLPQPERADLAFQLLQSLDPPGEEIPPGEFAAEIYHRIEAHRRGEVQGFSLDDARSIVQQQLAQQRAT